MFLSTELQAMDRIHRIGQYRPILITRLIIENSIESRILQLQEKKQAMVDSTIGRSFDLSFDHVLAVVVILLVQLTFEYLAILFRQ